MSRRVMNHKLAFATLYGYSAQAADDDRNRRMVGPRGVEPRTNGL